MKIVLMRTGGFTGIPIKKTIDTSLLEPEKAKEIENLVAGVADSPRVKPSPDRFTYSLSIQQDTLSRTIQVPEDSLTPELQRLLHLLKEVQ